MVAQPSLVMSQNIVCWKNVRGLNSRASRDVVRALISQENATVVCLQETKLSAVCNRTANEILGPMFDYAALPSNGASGGVLLGWRSDAWNASVASVGRFSITASLTPLQQVGDGHL